jgi:hypothetical protein
MNNHEITDLTKTKLIIRHHIGKFNCKQEFKNYLLGKGFQILVMSFKGFQILMTSFKEFSSYNFTYLTNIGAALANLDGALSGSLVGS